MADKKRKLQMMKDLHRKQEELYAEKNERYDDAYGKTYAEFGPSVALIRLEDKLNRAKALVKAGLDDSNGESLVDTLMDMSNYANMFLIELAGPGDFRETPDTPKRKKRNRKKAKAEESDGEDNTPEEESPLSQLTKSELVRVVQELGVTPPKKCNRSKLYALIDKFSMTDIAMAITAVKSEVNPEPETEGDE